jgi:hypothetical protein
MIFTSCMHIPEGSNQQATLSDARISLQFSTNIAMQADTVLGSFRLSKSLHANAIHDAWDFHH